MDGQRGTHTMANTKVLIYLHWTFWLWGFLKNKVYANVVTTLDKLRQAITDEMQAIPATMVHSVTLGVVRKAGLLFYIDGLQL